MKSFLVFILCFVSSSILAGNVKELEGHIGMVTVSFQEIQSELEGPNTSEAASGNFSTLASSFAYHFHRKNKYSFYGGLTVPMLTSAGVGYMGGFTGLEYYFNDVAHMVMEDSSRLDIIIQPKLRYHANAEIGVNYITYATEDTKKSDSSFGIGLGGGASYTFTQNWAVKAKAMVSKDVGLLTESMSMKVFIGGIFYLTP